MKNEREPGIGKTVYQDFKQSELKRSLKRDHADIVDFYFNEEQKERLKKMGFFKRGLYFAGWLFKSMFYKLSPVRRILLFIAIVLLFINLNGGDSSTLMAQPIISGVLFLFLLILELKDKLLATSELKAGRSLQFALIPEQSPKISGWDIWLHSYPARDVGGDFVDYIQLKDTRYGLALCDVAGKGLKAALLMTKLQATLRALIYDSSLIKLVIQKANNIFYTDTPSDSFASLIYLIVEPQSGELSYVNAGHLPPILFNKEGETELPKGDPAIGLKKDLEFTEKRISLDSNDILVVFSDGLSEAMDENNDQFGEERISAFIKNTPIISAQDLGVRLIEHVKQFCGEKTIHDDLSLLVLIRRS